MTRDLMHAGELKELVKDAYGNVNPSTTEYAQLLYDPEQLEGLPHAAVERSLGVGNHLRHAHIDQGETILDIGCGGGIDTIIAARRAGPTGSVIALDFLPAMLERTAAAAREARLGNVRVLEGEMESIPLPDESVDHIISNGVLNLSPRKARAIAECARVLRRGGKFTVADLTLDERELPPEILTHPAAWAG